VTRAAINVLADEQAACGRVGQECDRPDAPVAFSPLGRRVAHLLDAWVGIHHISRGILRRVDWSDPWLIRTACPSYANLATYDGDHLTRLVFLAHDLCVRVELRPHGPSYVGLVFTPRERDGDREQHMRDLRNHPTLDEAVAAWQSRGATARVPIECACCGERAATCVNGEWTPPLACCTSCCSHKEGECVPIEGDAGRALLATLAPGADGAA